jgi:hypothetical protein
LVIVEIAGLDINGFRATLGVLPARAHESQ